MKKTGQRWWLKRNNDHQLNSFIEAVQLEWVKGKDVTVQFLEADRSTNQNALIYALYGDIAKQAEDLTVNDVRAQCKLHYGVGILKANDDSFTQWYDQHIKGMTYEAKIDLMRYMDLTSLFTKEQASQYISDIIQAYTKQGFALADPHQAP